MIFTTLLTLALITVSLAIPAPVHLDRSLHTLSLPIRRDTTGTAPVYAIDRGIRWVVNISLGGQHLNVLLDTGSSPLWALSTFMSPEDHNRLPNHTWYNANASSTWQHTSGSFNVSYGDGSNKVEAIIGKEKVSLGGISTVMPIGACNYTTNSADTMGNDTDGILGLGFGEADETGHITLPTFMQSIQPQLPSPIFTLEVHEDQPGALNFGFVDTTKHAGALVKLPINNRTRGLWDVDHVSFGISNGTNFSSKAFPLLFDTGGLMTALPSAAAAAAYWAHVRGAVLRKDGHWVYPCNAGTPDLTFFMPGGNVTATLRGEMLNSVVHPLAGKNGMCYGGVQGDEGRGYIQVGKAFFLSFFTVWNQAEPSIAFAPYVGLGG